MTDQPAASRRKAAVRSFLVTALEPVILAMWGQTENYSNWLDCRGPETRPTYVVLVHDRDQQEYLSAARALGATVEEIHDGADGETYELRVGEPGTGWAPHQGES